MLGLVVLSGIFSGSETALVSISNSKVDALVAKKARNSKVLKKLKSDPHKLLITILIGNNIVNIGASAYAAVLMTSLYGSNGVGIATGVMTFLILVFGEITPKSFAHQHAEGFSLIMARPVYLLQLVLFPVVWFFDLIVDVVNKIFGGAKRATVTEGEIVAMLKIGAQEGAIESQERELIENVLEFNDIEVEEVMTPRVTIEALDCNATLADAVAFVIEHSHSRIPVYDGDLDNIVGILSIKELLRLNDERSSRTKLKNLDLVRPLEVPFSKKINKLFREFQRKHQHMAVVIDEYGGTAGIVTMEDLLEEIVGEIVDEFDHHETPIEIVNNKTIIVGGQTLVEDINDFFKLKIGPNERDTVSSLVIDFLHRFPREGEVIKMERATITVISMKKKLVDKVKITKKRARSARHK